MVSKIRRYRGIMEFCPSLCKVQRLFWILFYLHRSFPESSIHHFQRFLCLFAIAMWPSTMGMFVSHLFFRRTLIHSMSRNESWTINEIWHSAIWIIFFSANGNRMQKLYEWIETRNNEKESNKMKRNKSSGFISEIIQQELRMEPLG